MKASQTHRWRQRCDIPYLIVPSGWHHPHLGGGVVAERYLPLPGPDADGATDLVDIDNIDRSTRDEAALQQVGQEQRSLSFGDLRHARDRGTGPGSEGRESPLLRRRLRVAGDRVAVRASTRPPQRLVQTLFDHL